MKINVALYSMDKRCEERMLTVFKMNFKGLCVHTDIDDADVVLIDLDDKNSEKTWKEFRHKHAEIPAIIMATAQVNFPGAVYISKPAKLTELLNALKKASNKDIGTELGLNSTLATHKAANALEGRTTPAARKKETADNYDLYYNPEKFLQGKVLNAIKRSTDIDQSIFIRCWADRWIIVFPNSNYIFQNVKESQLRNLGLVQVGEDISYSEKIFSDEEIMGMSDVPPSQVQLTSTEKFIWDVSVRTSRGRIPEGTSLEEPYVLHRWPNLTRVSHIPNATRISAFWLDQPQSINHVVEKLSIPFEDVLTYFSAASATGLLVKAKRNEDNMVKPEVINVENKKRGIFAALMHKVSKNIVRNESTAQE